MGLKFMDRFSLLHFASGIIANFFNLSIVQWLVLHTVFEIVENSRCGVYFIDRYLFFWPGGKNRSDSVVNSVGDTFFGMFGWFVANIINEYYK